MIEVVLMNVFLSSVAPLHVCTIHDIRHLHVLLIFFISSNKQTMLITCVKVLTETKKIADEEA